MKKTALTWTRIAVPAAVAALALAACGSPSADDPSSSASVSAVASAEPMTDEPATTESMAASSSMAEAPSDDASMDDQSTDDQSMDDATSTDEAVVEIAGSYISYADYLANQEMYSASTVVLFFNASWCPTCQEADGNLKAAADNLPSGLTIVSVDYDSSDDVKRQYGVTTQHTFVQIDADGNELAKWTGSTTAEQIAQKTT